MLVYGTTLAKKQFQVRRSAMAIGDGYEHTRDTIWLIVSSIQQAVGSQLHPAYWLRLLKRIFEEAIQKGGAHDPLPKM
jgi:hypothetical protein